MFFAWKFIHKTVESCLVRKKKSSTTKSTFVGLPMPMDITVIMTSRIIGCNNTYAF